MPLFTALSQTADVLNTLVCDMGDGTFDVTNPDDLKILEGQIASALDSPDVVDLAESVLLDFHRGYVNLDDVRQRADEMLAVLMELENEMIEAQAWERLERLDGNMVATR